MDNKCQDCPIWKEKRDNLIAKSESMFDAAIDLENFEEECRKTCTK